MSPSKGCRRDLQKRSLRNRLLRSPDTVLNALRFAWIVILVWGEFGTFFWSLSSCRWPDDALRNARGSYSGGRPTHVLLLSDTQVRPPRAFSHESWLGSLRQLVFELNLRKNWHVTMRLRPHFVFFLGDMLAGGKYITSEAEYEAYIAKLDDVFPMPGSTQTFYLPGNNDIGMGEAKPMLPDIRILHQRRFGPLSQQVNVRNHTFVCLDAPGLVDEDYERAALHRPFESWIPRQGGSIEFIETEGSKFEHPVILLSHIPLARPDTASCGPLRERGTIRRNVGYGFQSTLGKQTSTFLLSAINPDVIFSGDDRDACEYFHPFPGDPTRSVKEMTIKSFSMAKGISRPGFQLLSINDGTPGEPLSSTLADTQCLLPDQYAIYTWFYLPFALATFFVVLFFNLSRRRCGRQSLFPPPLSSGSSRNGQGAAAPWSPYRAPVSPESKFPAMLRTPNTATGPTLRAVSNPVTPQGSPLFPATFLDPDEEDGHLYPDQYITYRSWEGRAHEIEQVDPEEYVPESRRWSKSNDGKKGWTYSWTFVFRGRRRRMTLRLPLLSVSSVRSILRVLVKGADSLDYNILTSTALTCISIFLWSGLLWVLIIWWTL